MIVKRFLALTVLAACGRSTPRADSCSAETRADHFTDGLESRGAAGRFDFTLVASNPAPPARGDNTWVVKLSAISAGADNSPVDGATITVAPFMPDHGHGATVKVNVTPLTLPGQYQLSPINLWMPGYWETTIQATRGALSDAAVFKVCISN